MSLRTLRHTFLAAAVTGMLAAASCSSNQPQTSESNPSPPAAKSEKSAGVLSRERTFTVPGDTTVSVVLDQALSSKDGRSGDSFDATLAEPLVVEGKTVVRKDARVRGSVINVVPSGRLQTPAELGITLTAIQLGGAWKEIATDSVQMKGSSHKTRNIEMIGGGSALGAIVGAVAGGGKGAAIGAAAGAGAGTAGAAATGKKDITLPAESRLTFHLKEPLRVTLKE